MELINNPIKTKCKVCGKDFISQKDMLAFEQYQVCSPECAAAAQGIQYEVPIDITE